MVLYLYIFCGINGQKYDNATIPFQRYIVIYQNQYKGLLFYIYKIDFSVFFKKNRKNGLVR